MLLFLSGVHGSKLSCIKVCSVPMQRQYSSHTSVLMEKLLCQHSLLTAKVTVSSEAGLEAALDAGREGGTDDGLRAA